MSIKLVAFCPTVPALRNALERHPFVELDETREWVEGMRFDQGEWHREIHVGDINCPVRGLVELSDNNPWVCADVASVPTAGCTLALIALGPLLRAGLVLADPVLQTNVHVSDQELSQLLDDEGWHGGFVISEEEQDLGSVAALQAIVEIRTPDDWEELDALFEECFSRSFYVRRDEENEWDASLVAGNPHALYRLRMSPDKYSSLLTIQVMADKNGKCGAMQLVHAMNVMAGFEESLGID